MAFFQAVQQMDPLTQLNFDYNLFLRDYCGGTGNPPAAPGPMGPSPLIPHLVQPNGILAPAPEDPPFRPAVIVDQEHLMHRGEGFGLAVVVVVALVFRGWVLISAIVGIVIFAVWKYVEFNVAVAKFYETEKFRTQGRLLPAAQPQQHYVIQQM